MAAPALRAALRAALPALLLAGSACAPAARVPPPSGPVSVRLVDSIPWENELAEGVLRRVELRSGARVDTLPGLLTYELPVVLDDALLGVEYQQDRAVRAFRYDLRSGRVRRLGLPADLHPSFSAPAFSPDGRHLAYVVVPGDATAWAMVRSWPERREVARGPRVEIPAGDYAASWARWPAAGRFEVYIDLGGETAGGWLRVRGSVAGGELRADTVPALPDPADPPA